MDNHVTEHPIGKPMINMQTANVEGVANSALAATEKDTPAPTKLLRRFIRSGAGTIGSRVEIARLRIAVQDSEKPVTH